MRQFHFILSAAITLFFCSGIYGQDIKLISGSKTKTIKAGTFISVRLLSSNQEPCEDCQKKLAGELISYENGELKLRILESIEPANEGKINVGHTYKKYTVEADQPVRLIPKDSILSITKKGLKKVRSRTSGEVVGIVLLMFGMSHILAAPVAEVNEKNTGGLFLLLGLSEAVAGTVIGTSFQQKQYITSVNCPQKRSGKKIWVLN